MSEETHPRQVIHERVAAQAKSGFARHQIIKESEGRWLLKRPYKDGKGWDGIYWVEVIALEGSGLYVGGDIDDVIFRYGPKHPEARVRWMAHRLSADDHYFIEKASIGSGREIVSTWNHEVAERDLADMRQEILDDEDEEDVDQLSDTARAAFDGLEEIIDSINCESTYDSVMSDVYDLSYYDEMPSVGNVVSPRLFYVHAALQRLAAILDARDAAAKVSTETAAETSP